MDAGKVGSFIRDRRTKASLTLRSVSGLAGVSIPYLSQVERGLRKPSAEILQGIAKALRISAETLYVQAGILEDRPVPDVAAAVMADPTISERHRQMLLEIYAAFREEGARAATVSPAAPAVAASDASGASPKKGSDRAGSRAARRSGQSAKEV
jgi:transcriptional regulator with XRE-family HTH domain